MADLFGKLVVRSHAPKRRVVLVSAAVLAAALLYAAFEMGRRDAGFRVVDSVQGALSASKRIRDLEAQNSLQREQLEAADVARRVDREGYKQVERSLGDMQSQIARLTQDLSFYRGLVQPDSLVHVKVQQMQIVPEPAAGQFRLKFVLMQTGKPEKEVSGSAALAIDGLLHGKPDSLSFYQVSPSRRGLLVYSFRYFQDYDEPVQLPAGFEPTRVQLDIHAGRDATHGFRQAFVWKAQGMSLETETAGSAASGGGAVGNDAAGSGTSAAQRPARGTAAVRVQQMFNLKPNKNPKIDTLIGPKTRIDGDVEFAGGLHLDGYINGNVSGEPGTDAVLSVSEQGGIEGSVLVSNIMLNGIVKGDIDATDRVELGENARVLGNVQYKVIETAVGAQINGRLIHRLAAGTSATAPGADLAAAVDDGAPDRVPR